VARLVMCFPATLEYRHMSTGITISNGLVHRVASVRSLLLCWVASELSSQAESTVRNAVGRESSHTQGLSRHGIVVAHTPSNRTRQVVAFWTAKGHD
jgi:hypothetical protein